jgi:hypothetical protein
MIPYCINISRGGKLPFSGDINSTKYSHAIILPANNLFLRIFIVRRIGAKIFQIFRIFLLKTPG